MHSTVAVSVHRLTCNIANAGLDCTRFHKTPGQVKQWGEAVERARMLLAYNERLSFFRVGQMVGVHHQAVERCVEPALAYGPTDRLDDRPRPGK